MGILTDLFYDKSTAYLITKVTDPPPPPSHSHGFAQTQLEWRNKQKFLSLSLSNLDALHDQSPSVEEAGLKSGAPKQSDAEPEEDVDSDKTVTDRA